MNWTGHEVYSFWGPTLSEITWTQCIWGERLGFSFKFLAVDARHWKTVKGPWRDPQWIAIRSILYKLTQHDSIFVLTILLWKEVGMFVDCPDLSFRGLLGGAQRRCDKKIRSTKSQCHEGSYAASCARGSFHNVNMDAIHAYNYNLNRQTIR
jgi:hypothetical protein